MPTYPVAYVRLLNGGGEMWQWAVGACPHCHEAHLHTATFINSTQHPRESLTWRLAKCRKSSVPAAVRDLGYTLVEEKRAETDQIFSEYAEAKAKAKAKAMAKSEGKKT